MKHSILTIFFICISGLKGEDLRLQLENSKKIKGAVIQVEKMEKVSTASEVVNLLD